MDFELIGPATMLVAAVVAVARSRVARAILRDALTHPRGKSVITKDAETRRVFVAHVDDDRTAA